MPGVRLTGRWTKIARAGECVYVTNIGLMPVTLFNASQHLMPGSSAFHVKLPADVSARAISGVTELAVTVAPGLTVEQPITCAS